MDISKCLGRNCPSRETCFRYTAKSESLWQSYASFEERIGVDGKCDYYWENILHTDFEESL